MAMKTNEEYIKELANVNPNIEVIGKYIGAHKKILHKCKICGNEWLNPPHNALRNEGCPVCSHRVIGSPPNYKNSIWASEYRKIAEYYNVSEEQMKTIMPMSTKEIDIICPICGNEIRGKAVNLFRRKMSCHRCSDGISYSEKFMASLLEQLNIKYTTQYITNWSNKKRYDFYLPYYNCIIETHGLQHYRGWDKNHIDFKQQQENDEFKKKLAKENGIEHYIVIDCRESTLGWIKNSILNSNLVKILNFNDKDIDWEKCNLDTFSSKVKIASDLWNSNETITIGEIANIMQTNYNNVTAWLKKASTSNMCNYTVKESLYRTHLKYRGENSKLFGVKPSENTRQKMSENHANVSGVNNPRATKVVCVETGKIYTTITEASMDTGANCTTISACCKGRYKSAGGYHWKYAKETNSNDVAV